MTALKDKIQDVLDESRMLILGAEVLVGFEFTAAFQEGFKTISKRSQALNEIALTLMISTLVLLIAPTAFHQVAECGEDSLRLHGFATRIMELALLPFALGLGASIYIPVEAIGGSFTGLVFGFGTFVLASCFWYGPILFRTSVKRPMATDSEGQNDMPAARGRTSLHDKIRQVLTEARVIIPGNQALLGFQFAVVLQKPFGELPFWAKSVHLASLSFIALSTVLLLTPAAYHRIVSNGEETQDFYQLAHIMVLTALPPLAAGVSADFFVVVYKTTASVHFSLIAGLIMLVVFSGMWFVYTWFQRNAQQDTGVLGSER